MSETISVNSVKPAYEVTKSLFLGIVENNWDFASSPKYKIDKFFTINFCIYTKCTTQPICKNHKNLTKSRVIVPSIH